MFKKDGVAAMGDEFSTNGKFTTAVINYLSENYARKAEPLIDSRYKKSYLITSANNLIFKSYIYLQIVLWI